MALNDLRSRRVARGLALRETAAAVGMSGVALSAWEAGVLPGVVRHALRLAAHFGTPAAKLFARDGAALRRERAARDWTQAALTEATGVPQSVISWWESGKRLAGVRRALALASFYGTVVEVLFARELLEDEDDVELGSADSGQHPAERISQTGTGG